jgi:hypothetical protein
MSPVVEPAQKAPEQEAATITISMRYEVRAFKAPLRWGARYRDFLHEKQKEAHLGILS